MQKIKAILSGSDGTLIDSMYMIRRGQYDAAIEYMVERGTARHGLPTYEEFERLVNQSVGGRSRETMERVLRLLFAKHEKQLEQINFDDLDRRLGPVQDRLATLYVNPFFDLADFLRWAGEQQLAIGIFTSSSRHQFIRNWGNSLPALGFTKLFSMVGISEEEKVAALVGRIKATYGLETFLVVTSDDVKATKPDPEGIHQILEQLSLKPDEAVMVGDLPADIEAGKKAGVLTIGTSHGFGTQEELESVGADKTVGSLAELRAFLENL